MKKLFFTFITFFLPMLASAYDIVVDGIYYNLDIENKSASVTYGDWTPWIKTDGTERYSGKIVIPETIVYDETTYVVTNIGDYVFYMCSELTSISFPNSITSIGYSPFDDETPWYRNLPDGLIYIGKIAYKYKGSMPKNTKIDIKEGTVEIYNYAFLECKGLTSVIIPEGVTKIGNFAFAYCDGLTSVIIPNSVSSIGNQAFVCCNALSSITIPDDISFVDNQAFYETPWLKNQPDGLIYIGKVAYAYKGDANNKKITIKDGTTNISPNAFSSCNLTSVVIPGSVNSIGREAFYECSKLETVTISNGVKTIEYQAFENCVSLTSIEIPESVTSLGDDIFTGCDNLKLITIYAPSLTSYGKIFYSSWSNYHYYGKIYVPKSGYSEYTSKWRNLASSIYYLGENSGSCGEDVLYSFEGSTGTLFITGEGRMSDFGQQNQTPWKSYSSSIKKVIIETGVTSIGDNAFSECSSLSSITIPISVDYISAGALSGTTWFDNEPDGLVYAGKVAYAYKGEMPENTEIIIKDGTLSITANSFKDCKGLTSITIPNSVVSIGSYAFSNCSSLATINIPNGVPLIGDCAFSNCISLTSVTIPESVTSIGWSAFNSCLALTSITIPNSVTTIGESAFSGCIGITSINIPNSVTSIGNNAFSGCNSLTSLTIPNSVTKINYCSFSGCI